MKPNSFNRHGVRGFSLLEVMIAVVVLSFGLLALASLQGSLARASADSKAQSVALTLAEEKFEGFRSFLTRDGYRQIGSIDSVADETLDRQGAAATFTRTTSVRRYVYDSATGAFVVNADTTGAVEQREYKLVEVIVSWSNAENQSQQVKLANIISSTSPEDSALTVRASIGTSGPPRVAIYAPSGEGIIPIAIGNNQAAASSNPQPELTRSGTTTMTQFNVQTYLGQSSPTPLLQRRVDNAVINCSCQLTGGSSTATAPAYAPTYWDGLRYRSPREVVGKPVAVSVTNFRQSESFEEALCTTCCRDHHDTAGTIDSDGRRIVKFDPWRPVGDIAANGNHNHYPQSDYDDPENPPAAVGSGQPYHEVCRLVRVDGIFRVATDTRLENAAMLRLSPNNEPSFSPHAVKTYSEFVKKYVGYAWNGLSGVWGGSKLDQNKNAPIPNLLESCTVDGCQPTSLATDATSVPESNMSIRQMLDVAQSSHQVIPQGARFEMVQRGLYIDYISDEAREALACVGSADNRCAFFRNKEVLEIIPFIAINLTKLADWNVTPLNIVSVRNDGISNAGYIRGLVTGIGATPAGVPYAEVRALSTRGNSGLVDRGATDPDDASQTLGDVEEFNSDGQPPPTFRMKIESSAPNTSGFDKNNLLLTVSLPTTVNPAQCTRQTGGNRDVHRCRSQQAATEVIVDFTNYNVADCPTSTGNNRYTYDSTNNICRRSDGQTAAPIFTDFKLCWISGAPAGITVQPAFAVENPGGLETTRVRFSGPSSLAVLGLSGDRLLAARFTRQGDSCPAAP